MAREWGRELEEGMKMDGGYYVKDGKERKEGSREEEEKEEKEGVV